MKKLANILIFIILFSLSIKAQIPISALPATSSLNGADVIPVVNSGVTKKITIDDLAAVLQPYFIPSGSILLVDTGSCPTLFTEIGTLNGRTLLGTVAANLDVGTTGGSDNITPTGTNSAPVFTGNALGTHSHTFTGTSFSDIINHTHTINITDPQHNHTQNAHSHVQSVNSATTGGLSGYTPDTSTNTSTTSGYSTATTTATNIAASTGITATSSNPAGGVSSITPAGTNSSDSAGTPSGTNTAPTFTGNSFDNRSAYKKVIFCKKN